LREQLRDVGGRRNGVLPTAAAATGRIGYVCALPRPGARTQARTHTQHTHTHTLARHTHHTGNVLRMQTTTKAKESGKAEAALLWAEKLTKTWDGEKYQFRDIELVLLYRLLSLALSLSLSLALSRSQCMYVCMYVCISSGH
jgi:hypothetical protein